MSNEKVEQVLKEIVSKKSPNNVVLYHAFCSDGFGAAWAASIALGRDCKYIPAIHGKINPAQLEGENLLILDFCFDLETLCDLERRFKRVVVLDHHKTSEEILKKFGMAVFDNNRSGAGITWDELNRGRVRPKLINYIEDRDLWNKALPNTDEISCITEITPYEFPAFDTYSKDLETKYDTVVARGKTILKYKNHIVNILTKSARMVRFAGYEVPCANSIAAFNSDLGNVLAQEQPFSITWRQASDGMFVYSLRSTDDGEDVGTIAAKMGGGGHRNSSGFHADKLLF